MNKKNYHIEFAKTGLGMSGGETCMIELIKFLVSKKEKNIILTTDNGRKVYEELGLLESEFIEYKIIDSYEDEKKYHIFIAYLKRIKKINKIIEKINFENSDIVFCHSDFFPNSLTLRKIYKKNKNLRFMCFFHMIAPNIFRGFEGEFLKKYNFPNLGIVHYKLNQKLYLSIINSLHNGKIIAVNPYYKKFLDKQIKNTNIEKYFLKIFGGVDLSKIDILEKKYDCVWMGRFHKQKGIGEFFDIVLKLKNNKTDIKIVVIGGGSKEAENNFMKNIIKLGLEQNIDYKGFINGKERFEILASAKIFMMTSYFEGRPISMLESLKIGIPIVAYDLPVYQVYDKGVVKVEILNNLDFSEKILEILQNDDLYRNLSLDAKEISEKYSWENTGREIYYLI